MTAFPVATPAQVRHELATTLPGRRKTLTVAVILLMAGAAAGLVVPRVFGMIVDVVAAGQGAPAVWRLGAVMAVAAIAAATIEAAGAVATARIVEGSIADLRERLVDRLLHLPADRTERAGVGDAVSRAGDDVTEVSTAASRVLPALTGAGFTIAMTFIGLGVVEWRFALALLLVIPFQYLAVRRYLAQAPPVYAAERAAMSDRAEAVLSSLRGRTTVRALLLEEQRRNLVARHSWAVVRHAQRARIVNNIFWGRLNLAEFVGMAALLLAGFEMVRRGQTTPGVTVTALLFFHRLFGPIGQLLMVVDTWQSGAASLRRIVGVLHEPLDRVDPVHLTATPEGRLTVDALTFSYRPDPRHRPTVDHIDLHVPAGQTLALVGASGAGKTTVAALVAGMHRPQHGRILLDDTDLATLPADQRSRLVGLVTQETHVFAGTLRDNLALAAPDATDDDIWQALHRVGAQGWVTALPEGLDEVVGGVGTALTPLQSQHLALARIELLDPVVVILDEATAETGSLGAAALDEAAAAVTAERTAVVIAHRLDQAAAADIVACLEDGQVVQVGTHAELVAVDGPYARAWEAWSAGR